MKKRTLTILTVTILSLIGLSSSRSSADIITVDCNGPSDFNSIQEAINSVGYGTHTIVVHPCVYYENISYYGKPITVTGTNPDDVNAVYATVIDGNGVGNVVTFNNGETDSSVLVGLTIQNGGRGIWCYKSDPSIRKSVVRANTNAGISCENGAAPFIDKCTMRSNVWGIAGSGTVAPTIVESIVEENNGGIYNCQGEISNCEIIGNLGYCLRECDGDINDCNISGNSYGLYYCSAQIRNCTVSGNQGSGLQYGAAEVLNCLISANLGAGLDYVGGSVTNCTIVGNKGDGLYCQGGAVASNNIIVRNDGVGCRQGTLKYNNVWQNLGGDYSGVAPGPNDISVNPRFAVPGYWDMDKNWIEGEYHLRSAAGRWDPASETWVIDDANSLCIDGGDPCTPVGVEPNPNGGRINQGVYGGSWQASKSPSGIVEPVCPEYSAMDFNKDCKVDFGDFALFAPSWLECNFDPPEACWE